MVENLISEARKFRSWIVLDNISDHSLVVFQLDFESEQGIYPFKLDHNWIGELDFNELVHKSWKHVDLESSTII